MSTDKTPFDHWWAVYPGHRKYNKKNCRKKFEKHDIEVQRDIWKHTKWWAGTNPDPAYVCAPEVYLNQERWEAGVAAPIAHPTDTNASNDQLELELHGLRKLQETAKEHGMVDEQLDAQIQALQDKMDGRLL